MALSRVEANAPIPLVEDATLRDFALATREADLVLIRWIDRRRGTMPADLAAFATVERDSRLMRVREVERRYNLLPYERAAKR